MMRSRTAPSETRSDSHTSCLSGPRCVSARVTVQMREASAGRRLWVNPAMPHTSEGSPSGFQLLRKNRVSLGRLKQLFEQHQALAQIAAGQLARPGVDIDIAANSVQVERKRVDEGLPCVFAERLAALR